MQYILDFSDDATENEIQSYLNDYGCTVIQVWDHLKKIKLVECDGEPEKTDIIENIEPNTPGSIKLLESDICQINPLFGFDLIPGLRTHTFSSKEKQDWWKNYVMSVADFDSDSRTISRRGQHVTVYIMDSGIDHTHDEFSEATINNIFTITPGDFTDSRGHGTALAGTISGKTCGFTDATIGNVKIFDESKETLLSDILDAFNAIMNDADLSKWNIINCSWSVPNNNFLNQRFNDLVGMGFIVMASSGNNGTHINNVTPACVSDVFTVGSIGLDLKPSDFSNYTASSEIKVTGEVNNFGDLDFWAPGEDIYIPTLSGGYGYASGTSLSAAISSAVFAYGLCDYIDDNGYKSHGYSTAGDSTNPLTRRMIYSGMHGLIDLSDPKYSSSTNMVLGIRNRSSNDVTNWDSPTDRMIVVLKRTDQHRNTIRVVNPYRVESIEFITKLPDGFGITSCGSLSVEEISEDLIPDPGVPFLHYQSKIKVTYNNTVGTALPDFEEKVIDIYVVNDQFTPIDVSEDHPINISLSFGNCNFFAGVCNLDQGGCNDMCGGSTCCDQSFTKGWCQCW